MLSWIPYFGTTTPSTNTTTETTPSTTPTVSTPLENSLNVPIPADQPAKNNIDVVASKINTQVEEIIVLSPEPVEVTKPVTIQIVAPEIKRRNVNKSGDRASIISQIKAKLNEMGDLPMCDRQTRIKKAKEIWELMLTPPARKLLVDNPKFNSVVKDKLTYFIMIDKLYQFLYYYHELYPGDYSLDQKIFTKRLDNLGIDSQVFLDKLKKTKGVVAGSFVAQCLLNETYSGSDVDVFIAEDQSGHTQAKFLPKYTEMDSWLFAKSGKKEKNTYIINDVVASRKYHLTSQACVNVVIITKGMDPKEHIKKEFDLSFCQSTFDGEKFEFSNLIFEKKGYIVNYDNFKPKQNHHWSLDQYQRNLKKIDKFGFGERGTSKNDTGITRIYPDVAQALSVRIKKYVDRGFTMIANPNEPEQLNFLLQRLSLLDSQGRPLSVN